MLVTVLGLAGYFLTTQLQDRDRDAEVNRRVQIESVQAQGVLADARSYVAGLAGVLQDDAERCSGASPRSPAAPAGTSA